VGIESTARSLIGVPWKHQGRSRTMGVDCVGLGVVVLRECGYTVIDRTEYDRIPDGTLRDEVTRVIGQPIALGNGAGDHVAPGDFVTIAYPNTESHVAIVSSDRHGLTIIHADNKRGEVVENRIDARWNRRIAGVWRPA
jgi:cell wall-associated NlpC family hydrolase